MVTLCQHCYDDIRAIDPAALIIGPAPGQISATATWLDRYFAAGGVRTIDVLSFHGYAHLPQHSSNAPETINDYAAAAKAMLAKYGMTKKPMWDTEGSWGGAEYGITDPNAQAAWVARSFLLHLSNGLVRLYWFAWDGGACGALWAPTNEHNPAALAYQRVYDWMVGASTPCSANTESTWTGGFSRTGGY